MFIRYCQGSKAWDDATVEDRKNFHAKLKESAKEHGLDLVFFGPAWGVIESPAWVLTSDKSLDNYYNWMRTLGGLGLPQYFNNSRTITLTEAPFLM